MKLYLTKTVTLTQIYESVWNVCTLLRSDAVLNEILDVNYRPWPKVKEGTTISEEFYKVHDRNKAVAMTHP
jgi:hypothetical protein